MPLSAMHWGSAVSIHYFVAEFLQAERYNAAGFLPPTEMRIVDAPNLNDPIENHYRLRILYYFRAHLLGEVPPDTQWFEVQYLTDRELSELHAVSRCGWENPTDPSDHNELAKVAVRKPIKLDELPADWKRIILWGHRREGPFTILEGNKRLTAYASTLPSPGLRIPVLVGISPTPCLWHFEDAPRKIANDLWKVPSLWPQFSL